MTNLQKKEIVQTIEKSILKLGSQNKVANKCEVSSATISQMRKENWILITSDLWLKVASKLEHNFSEWKIAPTTNYKMMQSTIAKAKNQKLFVPIAYLAGAGKTEGIKGFINDNSETFNYYLKCRGWAAREFLENLLQSIGKSVPRGYNSIDSLSQLVINFFVDLKNDAPSLFLDQGNSLKASSIKQLIYIYNEMEDQMSLLIAGTEALEKEIKRGVRYNKDGYDEIDSRLGRNYLKLFGNTLKDVQLICEANGIYDKKLQKGIFLECNPITKNVKVKEATVPVKVVEDTRRIKRIIIRERAKKNQELKIVAHA